MRSARFVCHISAQNLEPLTRRARACRRAPTERIVGKIRFSRNDVVTANAAGGFASQRGGGGVSPASVYECRAPLLMLLYARAPNGPKGRERSRGVSFKNVAASDARLMLSRAHAPERAAPQTREGVRGGGGGDRERFVRPDRRSAASAREMSSKTWPLASTHSPTLPSAWERCERCTGAWNACGGGRRVPPARMSVGRARGSCTRTTSPPARTPSPTPLSVWARCERCAGGWDARGGGRTGSPPNVGRPRAGEVGARDVSAGVHSFPEPPERLQALRARHRAMGRARRPPDAFPPTFGRPQAG